MASPTLKGPTKEMRPHGLVSRPGCQTLDSSESEEALVSVCRGFAFGKAAWTGPLQNEPIVHGRAARPRPPHPAWSDDCHFLAVGFVTLKTMHALGDLNTKGCLETGWKQQLLPSSFPSNFSFLN
jgi:hypothetical protein